MSNPILMKVQGFLDRASRNGVDLDPELVEEFKKSCGDALVKQLSRGKGAYSLRMSGLGRPLCQQWHDKQESDRNIEYNAIMRFLFGDIIEAIAMVILKGSGVNVQSEQEKVSLDLESCKLDGTLDVVDCAPLDSNLQDEITGYIDADIDGIAENGIPVEFCSKSLPSS